MLESHGSVVPEFRFFNTLPYSTLDDRCRRLRGSTVEPTLSMGLRPRLTAAAASPLDSSPGCAEPWCGRDARVPGWNPMAGQVQTRMLQEAPQLIPIPGLLLPVPLPDRANLKWPDRGRRNRRDLPIPDCIVLATSPLSLGAGGSSHAEVHSPLRGCGSFSFAFSAFFSSSQLLGFHSRAKRRAWSSWEGFILPANRSRSLPNDSQPAAARLSHL